MNPFRVITLGTLTAAVLVLGCGGDDPVKECLDCGSTQVHQLAQRDDVILTVEDAYNKRRIDWLDSALDPNFAFYMSAGYVGNGYPELWDRGMAIEMNSRLFDKNYAPLPCESIYMDFRTEEGVTWSEFNPPIAPSETWYRAAVYYDYKFKIGTNTTYIPLSGARAEFTVRDAGPSGTNAHHWQLVEMHDLGDTILKAPTASTESTTLGTIQMLYVASDCTECACDPAFCPTAQSGNLSQKEYVLRDIEAAYNERRSDWYDALLNPNFTFFLSANDVGSGLPAQWDRATEVLVHSRLLDRNYAPLPADSIYLDIQTEPLNFTWIAFNPASAPNETWYTTTIYYTFRIEIEPDTHIPLAGSKAQFTVRDTGPYNDDAHHWQLVEMRDLGGANLAAVAGLTEATSWGQVKALYR